MQLLHEAVGLTVERNRSPGIGIEDRDTDRGGVEQGLKIGPCTLLLSVRARVGDRGGRLGSEQHQDLFILVRERPPPFLVAEVEVADVLVAMAHRCALHRRPRYQMIGQAQFADVGASVRHPQRCGQVANVFEQPCPLGPSQQLTVLLRRYARGDKVLNQPGLVNGGDTAEARAGQRTGGFNHLVQHGVQIEAGIYAQAGCAHPGDALAQGIDHALEFVAALHDFFTKWL